MYHMHGVDVVGFLSSVVVVGNIVVVGNFVGGGDSGFVVVFGIAAVGTPLHVTLNKNQKPLH